MNVLTCTKGHQILVDSEDFNKVKDSTWYCNGNAVYTSDGKTSINIASFLIDIEDGMLPDHKDGNCHNNCKNNLRAATKSQNGQNVGIKSNNTTGYKGVFYRSDNGKIFARITVNKKKIQLGYFNNLHDAARAYNEAAKKYFGEFAKLNEIIQ